MFRMKKHVITILLICIFLQISVVAHADNWRKTHIVLYGDNGYPPYSFEVEGQPDGIYYRILTEATSRMHDYDVKLILLPWKRILDMAQHGDLFGFFPPYYRPDQRPYISEYSTPLYTEETVVCCRGTQQRDADWPQDYYNLRFGNQAGFLAGNGVLSDLAQKNLISLDESGGLVTNILKLLENRIDCLITDGDAFKWSLTQLKKSNQVSFSTEVISVEDGFVAYSKHYEASYRKHFIETLNAIILEMQDSGEIIQIANSVLNSPRVLQ